MPVNPAVTRLKDLANGWQDSEAPVTVNAGDAALLGLPLDKDKRGRPTLHATTTGAALFDKAHALRDDAETPAGSEPTPNQLSTSPGPQTVPVAPAEPPGSKKK